jgi:hypothetical protein
MLAIPRAGAPGAPKGNQVKVKIKGKVKGKGKVKVNDPTLSLREEGGAR